jgi:hypothetical protein
MMTMVMVSEPNLRPNADMVLPANFKSMPSTFERMGGTADPQLLVNAPSATIFRWTCCSKFVNAGVRIGQARQIERPRYRTLAAVDGLIGRGG